MRSVRTLVRALAIGAALVITPVAAMSAFAFVSGWRIHTVASSSMEPTLAVGSIVVTKPVSISSVRSGDVASFRTQAGTLIIHRVVRVVESGRGPLLVTRGDASDGDDKGVVDAAHLGGKLVANTPAGAEALKALFSPTARVAYVLIPPLLIALQSLVARRPKDQRLAMST